MAAKKTPAVAANIIHKDSTYPVKLHLLPRAAEFLRLHLKGETEPRYFKVDRVIHDIDQEGSTHDVDIHVSPAPDHFLTGKKHQFWMA
jgi:hypothetical protein